MDNNGWFIHAKPFCRHFGIQLDTTQKFVAPKIRNDGKLVLDLSNTVNVGLAKPRARKK